jgi:arabinofuranosyltransferase
MTAAPAPSRPTHPPWWLRSSVLWGAVLAWSCVLVASFQSVRSDDAFITYRYGQNLADGAGLVFNPGERLLGSTSPGQMLLSAAVFALAGPERTPSVMSAIGCLAWSAEAIALFLLIAPALGRGAAAAIAAAVLLGATGAAAWVPLETHLTAAATLFAFASAARKRWHAALACAALASWLRPDALVAALLLVGLCAWERRGRALGPVLTFVALFAPWLVFASLYYGSPLPQSAVAKFQRASFGEYLVHELAYPSRVLMPELPAAAQIALTMALAGLGLYVLWRRAPRLLLLAAFGCSHAAAYLVLRPFMVHEWHLYPWTLVLCVLCFAGLAAAPGLVGAQAGRVRLGWVCGLLLAGLLAQAGLRSIQAAATLADGYWSGDRHAAYREVADYLGRHAREPVRFASVEVGTIAFYSGLPAFDLGGLVTRLGERMENYPVRFIVVDRAYLRSGIRARELFRTQHGDFLAVVYAVGP